jgi:hypothetical protein
MKRSDRLLPDHSRLNRDRIRDYLPSMSRSITTRKVKGRTYEEQYQRLQEKKDPNSSLESEFLSVLCKSKHRLPDRALPAVVAAEVSAFAFDAALLVAARRIAELALESPVRAEGDEATGLFPLVADNFDRHLVRDGQLLECTCVRCGFRMIGGVDHSLEAIEMIHMIRCTMKKLPRSFGTGSTGIRIVSRRRRG